MQTRPPQAYSHFLMLSGGVSSWAAGRLAIDRGLVDGKDSILAIFADTKIEDEDTYRFLYQSIMDLGCDYIVLQDGRTPWECFTDANFIGNSRVDICSRILKRETITKWLNVNGDKERQKLIFGLSWEEPHRIEAVARRQAYGCLFPLNEEPFVSKKDSMDMIKARGIKPPRLYALGFSHGNCGGFCVKAGQAQFVNLLDTMPERYAYHERMETSFRSNSGLDVAIMRDRTGGKVKPLTMQAFRESIDAGNTRQPSLDFGSCSCFEPSEDDGAA